MVGMTMRNILEPIKRKAALWLRQGITPGRLALTLALGFAVGCLPVLGIPTLLCAGLALAMRLNLPAIQAANYAAMPLQMILIVPFVRLGSRLFASGPAHAFNAGVLLHSSPLAAMSQIGGIAGQALLAWLVIAIPAVALMTGTLTLILRRFPSITAAAGVGD